LELLSIQVKKGRKKWCRVYEDVHSKVQVDADGMLKGEIYSTWYGEKINAKILCGKLGEGT
jgi:hypothetical protein